MTRDAATRRLCEAERFLDATQIPNEECPMKRSAIGFILASAALALPSTATAADPKALTQDEQIALVKQLHKERQYGPALKLLDEMIGPVSRKEPIPKPAQRGWAFANLEVRKEKALILEEVAVIVPKIFPFGQKFRIHLWSNAVQEWVAIIRALAPTSKNANYYELYIEQKRCSLLAYSDLGTLATRGNKQDLDAKFDQLANDFQAVIGEPRVPANVRGRALAIVADNKHVLDESERRNREQSKSEPSPP
jgi:hypothetical protein